MLNRILDLQLPQGQSLFLWGARKTGKSTYLKERYPHSQWIDLLKNDVLLRYTTEPHLLRQELLAQEKGDFTQPIIIDEIQKAPALLDEIHWLIENDPARRHFILCGSSLRRLKHGGANLLGGRAWRQVFPPLCYPEMPSFDLKRILNHGLIPSHYLSDLVPQKSLQAYLTDYLIPEVQWESRIRELGAFTRFLDAIAFFNGEMLNLSNVAREASVGMKTVQAYVDLLIDMLIGYLIFPFSKSESRQLIISTPKFYFFDTGLTRILRGQAAMTQLKGPEVGHAFEHYLFLELLAYKEINSGLSHIQYWRTKTGLEVDFILDKGRVAIEVKCTPTIEKTDLKGLIAFAKEHRPERVLLVSLIPKKRIIPIDDIRIEIYPVEDFLSELWAKQII